MPSVAELFQDVGAAAGGLAFVWTVVTYGVFVQVKGEPEDRGQLGEMVLVHEQRTMRVLVREHMAAGATPRVCIAEVAER